MSARFPLPSHHQAGAALVVALVMLLVLTLLGATTARLTLLEERMTGNTQDFNVAFQAAEAALRDGEALLRQPILPDFDGAGGLYQPAEPDEPPLWIAVDFDNGGDVIFYDGLNDAPGSVAQARASYFVEELPRVPTAGESLAADAPVDEAAFFRVTARGVGAAGNAAVTLQTTYKR